MMVLPVYRALVAGQPLGVNNVSTSKPLPLVNFIPPNHEILKHEWCHTIWDEISLHLHLVYILLLTS